MSTAIPEEAVASGASAARPRAEVLRRADGIELIGEFEGSGFKQPPLIARRADGQVVQLTGLLYAVAEAADGQRDAAEIAAVVSEHCGRTVSADNVRVLAEEKLRPLGVLALADGSSPELPKREPLLALRHRKRILPAGAVNAGARVFTWLHLPFVTGALVLVFVAFDIWLFFVHGIAGGLHSAIYNPELFLAVLASVVVATAFHEFGHASACRYGGARPGHMGIGFYLIWPAFYCDVTDAYRLDRRARLRTDLGGVYFNAIFALLAGAVFFATGEEAALLAAVVQHVIMLQQLLPLLRFDGYYVLTDLTGVPDILSRVKPIFRSLMPGRSSEPQVTELRPWVRFVVTAYLLTLIPTLLFFFTWMMMAFPRVLATVHDSLGLQVDRVSAADGFAEGGVGVVRVLALVLPLAAISLSLARTTRMTGRGLVRWSRGSAPRTAAALLGTAAALGALGYALWPDGDYEPIRPGERGTVGEAVEMVSAVPTGHPAVAPAHELRYAAVPTEREAEELRRRGEPVPSLEGDEQRAPGDRDAPPGSELGGELGDWETSSGTLDGSKPPPGDGTATTTEPGTTEPAPGSGDGTSTTTEPAPSTGDGTSTTTEPAPSTGDGSSTTTEPAPSTDGTSTTDSTSTAPLLEERTATETGTTTTPSTTTTPTP